MFAKGMQSFSMLMRVRLFVLHKTYDAILLLIEMQLFQNGRPLVAFRKSPNLLPQLEGNVRNDAT